MKNDFYPRIKFKVSYRKDVFTFFMFLNEGLYRKEGRFLDWAIFEPFPRLKKYVKDFKLKIPESEISKFVKKYYLKNQKLAEKNMKVYEDKWKLKESGFYRLTDELFGNYPWPKGKYIAYSTMWRMYPRYLDDKTFQIPDKSRSKEWVNAIIGHEMLHFIFYDYFYKNKKYKQFRADKYESLVWNTAEIFNTVVMQTKKWTELIKKQSLPYPEHEEIAKKLLKKYKKKEEITADEVIEDIIASSDYKSMLN